MGERKERLVCLTAGGFVVAVPLFFVSLKRRLFLSLSGDMEKQASSHPPYRCVMLSRESRTLPEPPLCRGSGCAREILGVTWVV